MSWRCFMTHSVFTQRTKVGWYVKCMSTAEIKRCVSAASLDTLNEVNRPKGGKTIVTITLCERSVLLWHLCSEQFLVDSVVYTCGGCCCDMYLAPYRWRSVNALLLFLWHVYSIPPTAMCRRSRSHPNRFVVSFRNSVLTFCKLCKQGSHCYAWCALNLSSPRTSWSCSSQPKYFNMTPLFVYSCRTLEKRN